MWNMIWMLIMVFVLPAIVVLAVRGWEKGVDKWKEVQ